MCCAIKRIGAEKHIINSNKWPSCNLPAMLHLSNDIMWKLETSVSFYVMYLQTQRQCCVGCFHVAVDSRGSVGSLSLKSSESSGRADVDHVPFLAAKIFEGSKAILKFLSACVKTGDWVSGKSDALNLPTPWWWLRQPPALRIAHRAACSKVSNAFRACCGSSPVVEMAMYMYRTPPSS